MKTLEELTDFSDRFEAAKGDEEARALLHREAFDFIDVDQSGLLEKDEIAGLYRAILTIMLSSHGMKAENMPEEDRAA